MTPGALQKSARPCLVVIAAARLATGLAGRGAGMPGWAAALWTAATLPVQGALLQEVIDVAVILNALRALRRWFGRGSGAIRLNEAAPDRKLHDASGLRRLVSSGTRMACIWNPYSWQNSRD